MNRILRISGVILLGLAAVLVVACDADDEQSPFGPVWGRWHRSIKGTVTQLDNTAHTLSVRTKRGVEIPFTWDATTKVEGALAQGAMVGVRFKKQPDGHNHARLIRVFGVGVEAGTPAAVTTETKVNSETKIENGAPTTTTEVHRKTTTETPKK
jgi:hypothetical protein